MFAALGSPGLFQLLRHYCLGAFLPVLFMPRFSLNSQRAFPRQRAHAARRRRPAPAILISARLISKLCGINDKTPEKPAPRDGCPCGEFGCTRCRTAGLLGFPSAALRFRAEAFGDVRVRRTLDFCTRTGGEANCKTCKELLEQCQGRCQECRKRSTSPSGNDTPPTDKDTPSDKAADVPLEEEEEKKKKKKKRKKRKKKKQKKKNSKTEGGGSDSGSVLVILKKARESDATAIPTEEDTSSKSELKVAVKGAGESDGSEEGFVKVVDDDDDDDDDSEKQEDVTMQEGGGLENMSENAEANKYSFAILQ
ncbi:hypothetical protein QBC44DRAFT_58397 [Cladorrhinum sp. PSN332]|nr:hypothetical protein QBC44DRAFT_58397 [Cladorrhinum sp. PSN332]